VIKPKKIRRIKFCEKYPDKSCQYSWTHGITGENGHITLSCRDKGQCFNMVEEHGQKNKIGNTGCQGDKMNSPTDESGESRWY
jgi:hypothetical protein